MNDKFKKLINKKGLTAYQISKKTGIPYTTIFELLNGKTDINKCAAGTVFRLTLFLKCEIEDILNKEPLIVNMSGTYKKIKYCWKKGNNSQTLELHIVDGGKEKVIDESYCNQGRFYQSYENMTKAIIKNYLKQKQAEEMLHG